MRTHLPTYRAVLDGKWYSVVETSYHLDKDGYYTYHRVFYNILLHKKALAIVAQLQRDQQNRKDFGTSGPYIGFPTLV